VTTTTEISRAAIAAAALSLVQDHGLEALTMRSLADRMSVKAASLYWHVRDRRELLDLAAAAMLERIPLAAGSGRAAAVSLCAAALTTVTEQRDGAPILRAAPGALRRSPAQRELARLLCDAQPEPVAAEVAAMILWSVLAGPGSAAPVAGPNGAVSLLAIDSGSRGVHVRAGTGMDVAVRSAGGEDVAAASVSGGDRYTVRRLRGRRQADVEIAADRPWAFQVQGATTGTTLDLGGVDVRHLKVDSSAVKVECILPRPRGIVPIEVSSGVVKVALRRPPGVAVTATVSSGSVQVALDDAVHKVTFEDVIWETPSARDSPDRYELRVSSGVVRVRLDDSAPDGPAPPAPPPRSEPATLDDPTTAAVTAILEAILSVG
jgi:AcrR family transcriptional regulator